MTEADEIKDFYETTPFPGSANYDTYFAKTILPLIRGRKVDNVWDAGCGTGNLSRTIADSFPEANVVALDFSERAIDEARSLSPQYHNIQYHRSDIIDFQNPGDTFDLIFCQGVLHHSKSPKDILRRFHDGLSKDGIALIWLYNPFGRRGIEDVMRLDRCLEGEKQPIEERLMALSVLIETLGEREAPVPLAAGESGGTHYEELVDRYCNPYYRHYTVNEAQALFSHSGFDLLNVAEFAVSPIPPAIRDIARRRGVPSDTPTIGWQLLEVIEKPRGLTYVVGRS